MDLKQLTQDQLKHDIPVFREGDTIKIANRIKEGDKVRTQMFEGVVIKRNSGTSIDASFTLRKIASGVGVERTFLIHSPNVLSIEVVRHGDVRRARLYYLRNLRTKSINIKEKKDYTASAAHAEAKANKKKGKTAAVKSETAPAE